jgi:nucleoside diphosphate kinase
LQRTFAMFKPDLVASGKAQEVIDLIKENGFTIVSQEQVQFTIESAGGFYVDHKSKPYFDSMTSWLSGGPIMALILEKENAVSDWREMIGPTNPQTARETAPNR